MEGATDAEFVISGGGFDRPRSYLPSPPPSSSREVKQYCRRKKEREFGRKGNRFDGANLYPAPIAIMKFRVNKTELI